MNFSRRKFLLGSASAAIVASTHRVPRIWADANVRASLADGQRILVVVQFSGGNDGINTVIPYADDVYHQNRFATRIEPRAVLRIDDYLGWHPSLTELAAMQHEHRLSIVQGVGYPNPNRSHFESMDIWHSARLEPPHRTGWIGRWLDERQRSAGAKGAELTAGQTAENSIGALHVGDEPLPLALTGLNVMVPSLQSIESLRVTSDPVVREALADSSAGHFGMVAANKNELLEFLQSARSIALTASKKLQSVEPEDLKGYDGSPLSSKLASVAKLISIEFGPRVYYVEISGFDTHSQQPEAHAALLGEVSRAVSAFYADLRLRSLGDRVLTVCFSEFGRRVRENGSRGTDHGTAAPVIIAGPEGLPPLVNKYPSLTDLDSGDLKFTTDFRCVYATVLEKWLDVSSSEILGKRFEILPISA